MRKVAFELRLEGMVKEGATHLSVKRTTQSEETSLKGKELTGSQKTKEFCTTKLFLSSPDCSKFFQHRGTFSSSTACMNCLITVIIQCQGLVFDINRNNALETDISVLSHTAVRIQLSNSSQNSVRIINKGASSIYPLQDSRTINPIYKYAHKNKHQQA